MLDSSPIIAFEELGYIDYLRALEKYVEILIPEEVAEELGREPVLGRRARAQSPSSELSRLPRRLGKGETGAISLSLELRRQHVDVTAVTDDRVAREVCRRLGISCTGSLGLIKLVKKLGILSRDAALSLLNRIPSTNLYVTPQLLEAVAGEIRRDC